MIASGNDTPYCTIVTLEYEKPLDSIIKVIFMEYIENHMYAV